MFKKPKHSGSNNLPDISQLNDYFGDLVTEKHFVNTNVSSPADTSKHAAQLSQFSLKPISIYSTLNLLQNIKVSTAMGHDGIPAFF